MLFCFAVALCCVIVWDLLCAVLILLRCCGFTWFDDCVVYLSGLVLSITLWFYACWLLLVTLCLDVCFVCLVGGHVCFQFTVCCGLVWWFAVVVWLFNCLRVCCFLDGCFVLPVGWRCFDLFCLRVLFLGLIMYCLFDCWVVWCCLLLFLLITYYLRLSDYCCWMLIVICLRMLVIYLRFCLVVCYWYLFDLLYVYMVFWMFGFLCLWVVWLTSLCFVFVTFLFSFVFACLFLFCFILSWLSLSLSFTLGLLSWLCVMFVLRDALVVGFVIYMVWRVIGVCVFVYCVV